MSDATSRERTFRVIFDGAVVVAIAMNIGAGLYWAGIIHQQVQDVRTRVSALEQQIAENGAAMTTVAVRLGQIDQKLTDIGQKVGLP